MGNAFGIDRLKERFETPFEIIMENRTVGPNPEMTVADNGYAQGITVASNGRH
jgi:hypothetical protein